MRSIFGALFEVAAARRQRIITHSECRDGSPRTNDDRQSGPTRRSVFLFMSIALLSLVFDCWQTTVWQRSRLSLAVPFDHIQ